MKSKEEIKKGCGESIYYDDEINTNLNCGDIIGYHTELCPTCQALLEQAIEFEKEIGDLKFLLGDITIERDYYKSCFEKQAQEFKEKIEELERVTAKRNGMKVEDVLIDGQELLKEVQGDKE